MLKVNVKVNQLTLKIISPGLTVTVIVLLPVVLTPSPSRTCILPGLRTPGSTVYQHA